METEYHQGYAVPFKHVQLRLWEEEWELIAFQSYLLICSRLVSLATKDDGMQHLCLQPVEGVSAVLIGLPPTNHSLASPGTQPGRRLSSLERQLRSWKSLFPKNRILPGQYGWGFQYHPYKQDLMRSPFSSTMSSDKTWCPDSFALAEWKQILLRCPWHVTTAIPVGKKRHVAATAPTSPWTWRYSKWWFGA